MDRKIPLLIGGVALAGVAVYFLTKEEETPKKEEGGGGGGGGGATDVDLKKTLSTMALPMPMAEAEKLDVWGLLHDRSLVAVEGKPYAELKARAAAAEAASDVVLRENMASAGKFVVIGEADGKPVARLLTVEQMQAGAFKTDGAMYQLMFKPAEALGFDVMWRSSGKGASAEGGEGSAGGGEGSAGGGEGPAGGGEGSAEGGEGSGQGGKGSEQGEYLLTEPAEGTASHPADSLVVEDPPIVEQSGTRTMQSAASDRFFSWLDMYEGDFSAATPATTDTVIAIEVSRAPAADASTGAFYMPSRTPTSGAQSAPFAPIRRAATSSPLQTSAYAPFTPRNRQEPIRGKKKLSVNDKSGKGSGKKDVRRASDARTISKSTDRLVLIPPAVAAATRLSELPATFTVYLIGGPKRMTAAAAAEARAFLGTHPGATIVRA